MPTPATCNDLPPEVAEATNVLLLVESLGPVESEACADLLTAASPDGIDLLSVTFTDTPDGRMKAWRTNVADEAPDRMCVITVGDSTRSAASSTGTGSRPTELVTHTVPEAGNLTKLGVRVTEQLTDWKGDGNQTTVDFDSLTALLQYAPRERTFQFLHVLRGRLESLDAVAHYHMDPSVHDDRTINTFKSLMDAVVSVDENGEWTVDSN